MLKAENINKIFKQGPKAIHAVENVNLNVSEGERVYIHGRSGAGKSTLLNILGGLRLPSEGEVTFRGNRIYRISDKRRSMLRNGSFGFVFQLYHLLPELSVLENVMLPARIKGGESGKKIKDRAVKLLDMVGMEDRLGHKPSQISGGEAQRTAIARALVNSPDILFCDEPTGNLDSEMSADVYGLIHNISENEGMSVVVVSHQEVRKDFFHSEYVMEDGRMEEMQVISHKL